MTLNSSLFSSKNHYWQTPPELYNDLNDEFDFDCDVCTTRDNPLQAPTFMVEDVGLQLRWRGNCFMNPPYGRHIYAWIRKAYTETVLDGNANLVVALLPARTDTKWFHTFIYSNPFGCVTIRFLFGRIKFVGAKNSAPFPSMICIFKRPK